MDHNSDSYLFSDTTNGGSKMEHDADENNLALEFGDFDEINGLEDWVTPPEIRERIEKNMAKSEAAVPASMGTPVPDSAISRIGLTTSDKAGMQNVDVSKANQIIFEMSKNSKFFLNEKRKEEQVRQRVEQMLKQLEQLPDIDLPQLEEKIDKRISALELTRDLSATWIHIDMDGAHLIKVFTFLGRPNDTQPAAFYASVEIRDDPSLNGKPIGVGSSHMLTTASYEARKFGVRSAMPGFIAKQLCPELIFVPLHPYKYSEASRLTRAVMAQYDPNYEPYSLDEAALNLTEYLARNPDRDVEDVAEEIKAKIFESTKLTCSIGISPNKRLAKMCADVNKPNGKFRLLPDRQTILEFVQKQPCRKINGIGKVTEQMLKSLGVTKVSHILEQRVLLYRLFSQDTFDFFISAALGLGSNVHSERTERKSIGIQRTFRALGDREQLLEKLREIAHEVVSNLKGENLRGRKVTLFLKTTDFEVRSKTSTLSRFVDTFDDIYNAASKLLISELPVDLRLLGIRMSDFPKAVSPPDEHQRTISQFFKTSAKSGSSSVATHQEYELDEDDIDLFADLEAPSVRSEPTAQEAKKPSTIESLFAASQLKPTTAKQNQLSEPPLENQIQIDDDDDLVLVGQLAPPPANGHAKKRKPGPSSTQASSSKRSKVSKDKGQATLEIFMKPDK